MLRVHEIDSRRKLPFMSSVSKRRRQLMRGEWVGFCHPWFNDLLSPGCSARPSPRRSRSRHKGDHEKRSKWTRGGQEAVPTVRPWGPEELGRRPFCSGAHGRRSHPWTPSPFRLEGEGGERRRPDAALCASKQQTRKSPGQCRLVQNLRFL